MDAGEVLELQNRLIGGFIGAAPRGWQRIFLNCEMEDHPEGMSSSTICYALRKRWWRDVECIDLSLSGDDLTRLTALGRRFMAQAKQNYLTLDLLVRNDGKFRSHLDYERPIRLDGDLAFDDRHRRYMAEDDLLAQWDKVRRARRASK